MKRDTLLEMAKKIVTEERKDRYGEIEDNFKIIARYWSIYLGIEVTPQDVPIMMTFLKLARIQTGKLNYDNYIDVAGYIACAGELASDFNVNN